MATHKNGVMFLPLKDESDEDYDNRVARWMAGETVEGMDREYTGREYPIIVVRFVAPPERED